MKCANYWAALGILAFCCTASGQARDCSSASHYLHSNTPADKAWGAQLASTCGLSGLTGEIGKELLALDPDPRLGSDTFWADRAMLDALIRLDVLPPPPLLTSITQAFPKEAAILLLRDAPSHLELLAEIRKHGNGGEWVAASNALSRLRAPGFAASILTGLTLRHRFLIAEPGQPAGGGIANSRAWGFPTIRVPTDFPATAVYELNVEKWPDGDLISDGPTPIYSHRTVWEPGVGKAVLSGREMWCLPCQDVSYLGKMAEMSSDRVESAIHGETIVRSTDRAQFSAEISRAIAGQESDLQKLASALIATGALGGSETALTLHIEIEVLDQRYDRSVPLPSVNPKVDFQLR